MEISPTFWEKEVYGNALKTPPRKMPNPSATRVITGYLAGTVRLEGRPAYLADAVANAGSAFLGMTGGCARCHDHKFDPVPTADYYALYGLFASTGFPDSGGFRYQ